MPRTLAIGRKNYVVNPSFEVNTSGWGNANPATLTRITTDSVFGTACMQVDCTSTSASGTRFNPSSSLLVLGDTWTASAYVKATTAGDVGKQIKIHLNLNGHETTISITLSATWTRYSVTGTVAFTTPAFFAVDLREDNGVAVSFLTDGVLLEKTNTLGSYFDGSFAGCQWEGTANNSISDQIGRIALAVNRQLYQGFARQYDGVQNFDSLGTLGNLGSNLGSGFYCKFDIKTTQTALAEFGLYNGTTTGVMLGFNASAFETHSTGHLALWLQSDSSSHRLIGHTTNTVNFNDGNKHTLEFDANLVNNTISIIVDSVSQAITYNQTGITANVSNFTKPVNIGARNNFGAQGNNPLACTLDNFQIGTSAGSLYGSYTFDKKTLADSSGNGNDGTAGGNPTASYVLGLSSVPRQILATRTLVT